MLRTAWFPNYNATLWDGARFRSMGNVWNDESQERHRTAVEARQAVSGVGVRYVLVISMLAALAGMFGVYYFLFSSP